MTLRSPAYTLFMLLALAVFLLARHVLPKPPRWQALPWRKRAVLALSAFVGGSLGAKLPFALAGGEGVLSPQAWLADGKTVMAALIGGYLAVEVAKLLLDVRVKTGDTFAVPLALALAVGRWGCFCNGCCYGTETDLPWSVPFVQPDGRLAWCHPTQVYESLFHFTMALLLLEVMRRGWLPCQRLKLYLIAYAAYRFATEYIRPEPRDYLGLTFYQWAAVVLAAGLTVQWFFDRNAARAAPAVA
jgi:phosphatidylglycerol:prolipoprotein diacylglycerol transferase